MQMVEINEIAAAQAMLLVVGDEARRAIEDSYTVIDGCMKIAYAAGRGDEQQTLSQQEDTDYAEGYGDGFNRGYDAGHLAATSTEQPVVLMPDTDSDGAILKPPYQGDSGDETRKQYEDADLRDIPLYEGLFEWLTEVEFYQRQDADFLALKFMRFWMNRLSKR